MGGSAVVLAYLLVPLFLTVVTLGLAEEESCAASSMGRHAGENLLQAQRTSVFSPSKNTATKVPSMTKRHVADEPLPHRSHVQPAVSAWQAMLRRFTNVSNRIMTKLDSMSVDDGTGEEAVAGERKPIAFFQTLLRSTHKSQQPLPWWHQWRLVLSLALFSSFAIFCSCWAVNRVRLLVRGVEWMQLAERKRDGDDASAALAVLLEAEASAAAAAAVVSVAAVDADQKTRPSFSE